MSGQYGIGIPPERALFCNRTLNMRAIRAVGYDMDYTLVHYKVEEWEQRAYDYLKQYFLSRGWPVEHLEFQPEMVTRGLIVDTENGNLLKANRFGFVKRAFHGTRLIDFEKQREIYSRTMVDLSDRRWVFLNTLFSLSEGCMYAQLVDLLDERKLPDVLGYEELYRKVRKTLDTAHMEGRLKGDILGDPDRFIVLDPEVPLTLLDQRNAGKKLLLITNSEWSYTSAIMTYCFDRFLPKGMTWKNVFDLIIVGARKPDFFTTRSPFFEIATEEGLLRPTIGKLEEGKAYLGGSAVQTEEHLGLSGDEILYVGDHMFGDVHVTKNVLRWRTALVLRELEDEVLALRSFDAAEGELERMMAEKELLEAQVCLVRLSIQRKRGAYGPQPAEPESELQAKLVSLKSALADLDARIGPLAKAAGELYNSDWGPLMRAGNDKSHLARQVERYADVYTSRVSNLLHATPYVYLRSPRGDLPHDRAPCAPCVTDSRSGK